MTGRICCIFFLSSLLAAGLFGCASSQSNTSAGRSDLNPEGVFPTRSTTRANGSRTNQSDDVEVATDAQSQGGDVLPQTGGWSILLESFPGRDQLALARQRLPHVSRMLGRNDVQIRAVNHGYAIVLGSYEEAESPAAERDLQFARTFRVGNQVPYGAAWLVPPRSAVIAGERPEMNLAYARRVWPNARYSLQVEVYQAPGNTSTSDRAKFRRAAEERAFEIRQEGDPAFYYHGRNMSMVTIGLFTTDDYDDRGGPTAVRSPELRALMERYPLNLMNGMEQWEKGWKDGQRVERRQRSMLIHVP